MILPQIYANTLKPSANKQYRKLLMQITLCIYVIWNKFQIIINLKSLKINEPYVTKIVHAIFERMLLAAL
jgi:hypothetical protein